MGKKKYRAFNLFIFTLQVFMYSQNISDFCFLSRWGGVNFFFLLRISLFSSLSLFFSRLYFLSPDKDTVSKQPSSFIFVFLARFLLSPPSLSSPVPQPRSLCLRPPPPPHPTPADYLPGIIDLA